MPIRVICESCQKGINAPDSYAGKTAKCPGCGYAIRIPESNADQPNVSDEAQSSYTPSTTSPPLPDPPEPSDPHNDLFSRAAPLAGIVCPVLAIVAALVMVVGSSDVALFISGLCLLLSLSCLTVYSHLVKKRREAEVEREKAEKHAVESNSRYKSYERDFDAIVRARVAELQAEQDRRTEKMDQRESQIVERENREQTVFRLGKRLLDDTVKNVSQKLTPNNFTASRDRLTKAIDFCRKHEYDVTPELEQSLISDLREQFELAVRRQHDKEEQARIKARIREEQKAEKEIERELARVDAEKKAIEKALATALKEAANEHSAEVEALRAKLVEAEERAQRAKSMAEQTRAGHVYVISNLGSFGEDVYKIGMTRRLEPLDRVKELGDASVPFPFDVHMMISCDDAPKLENLLHREFHRSRLNKVNLRKEFFRVDLERIREVVEANHGEVSYQATPDAFDYRESLAMTDDDFEMVAAIDGQHLNADVDE